MTWNKITITNCKSENPLSHSCLVKNPILFASIFHAMTNIATFSGSTPRSSQNFSIPSGPEQKDKMNNGSTWGLLKINESHRKHLPIIFGSSTLVYSSNHNVHRFVLKVSSVFADFRLEQDNILSIGTNFIFSGKHSLRWFKWINFSLLTDKLFWNQSFHLRHLSSLSVFEVPLYWTEKQ